MNMMHLAESFPLLFVVCYLVFVFKKRYNHYLNMVQSRPTDSKYVSKPLFVDQPNLLQNYEFEGGLTNEEVLGDLYDFLICGASFSAIMENQAAEVRYTFSFSLF
jgi:hypothetical protein